MQRTLPEPRAGVLGVWDRLVGPGMTLGETTLVLSVATASAVLVALHLSALGLDGLRVLVGAIIAFDVIGGAVCTMTDTTKRWTRRAGQTVKDHLSFVSLHLVHIGVVAWLFRGVGFDAVFMVVMGGWLMASALLMSRAPGLLKQPLAVALYIIAFAAALYVVGPTPGLEWFAPLLFLKLLIGHATPHRSG